MMMMTSDDNDDDHTGTQKAPTMLFKKRYQVAFYPLKNTIHVNTLYVSKSGPVVPLKQILEETRDTDTTLEQFY